MDFSLKATVALGMCTLTCPGVSKVRCGLPPALRRGEAQEVWAEQLQDAGLPCQRGVGVAGGSKKKTVKGLFSWH